MLGAPGTDASTNVLSRWKVGYNQVGLSFPRSAVLAEEVFQSGPQIRREWAEGELHADLVNVPNNDPVHRAAAFR
jgi:hypothetical protein